MCYKGYSHLFSITCDISTVSELKMREQCYIKINNNNNNNNICIQAAHTLLRTGVPPSNPSSESCFSHHFDHSLWFLCVSVPTAIAHTRCTQEFPPSNLSCESCFNHHFDHSAGGGGDFCAFPCQQLWGLLLSVGGPGIWTVSNQNEPSSREKIMQVGILFQILPPLLSDLDLDFLWVSVIPLMTVTWFPMGRCDLPPLMTLT